MHTQKIFNDGEHNEILRWKDLSFKALIQVLELPISFHKSVILAGGVYTSWHHKEDIKDIDVFILDDGHDAAILNYLKSLYGKIFTVNSLKDVSEYKRDNPNINDVYNAKTILPHVKYQFIFTKYKTREELISHFDYLHCTPNYYDSHLYVRKDAFEAIRDKKLVIHNKDNQVEWRKAKFLIRGFTEAHVTVNYHLGAGGGAGGSIIGAAGGGTWSSTAGAGGGGVTWGPYRTNIAKNV